jgi:hypothetical protein
VRNGGIRQHALEIGLGDGGQLPIAIDSTDRMISIDCQSSAIVIRPLTSRRITMAKAANLGAEPMNRVTEVGAP